MSRIDLLLLTDFRSYQRAEWRVAGRNVFLFGPNGAGKTNLLEAISLLSPGRGLRGAPLAEIGRRGSDEKIGRAWAVSACLIGTNGPVQAGTGIETATATRRLARIEGEAVPVGRLSEQARPMWLTPVQDRLFLEGAGDRRRFFDRLVYAARPGHARHVGIYERALRERGKVLAESPGDGAWLTALEAQMASAGAQVALARGQTLTELSAEIELRGDRAFPRAGISLTGEWESLAVQGRTVEHIAALLAEVLAAARARDAAAGRALAGPHRGDLAVTHLSKGRAAAECSTGEQKALILNLVLAQAARLSRNKSVPNPILLLDEIAAHLDPDRRAALFDEIEALSLQAFMTGTDEALFETLKGRALGVHVDASHLTPLD